MRKVVILAFVAIGVLGVGAAATAQDDDGSSQNGARLNGYQEVTSISTTGFGSFHIKFNKDDTADYVLSYRGIETPVTQAHIHFAQRSQNGPIQVWLCDGDPAAAPVPPARPPGSPPFPTCPAFGPDGGTVSGTAVMITLGGRVRRSRISPPKRRPVTVSRRRAFGMRLASTRRRAPSVMAVSVSSRSSRSPSSV